MKKFILYLIIFIAIIMIWQYIGTNSDTGQFLVSSPSLCLEYFLSNKSNLLLSTAITLLEAFLGLILAFMLACVLMLVCFRYHSFYKFIMPIILTSQVIPLITLAPFFILWLGLGISSKIALAALISFYPIFMNFASGYNSISNNIFELLDIYTAKLRFRIFKVYFPLAMQSIFTGLKIAATLSVIGAIVAEFSGAKAGLGKNLLETSTRIEPELMMLSIIMSACIGILLFGLIYFLERSIGKWYLADKQLN